MQTSIHGSHPVLSQTQNNTTLWIGHLDSDPTERFAGQTFICPADGSVNNIQVYSSTVQQEGDLGLTLHEFDTASNTWGPSIGEATQFLKKGDDSRWILFRLIPVSLKKNVHYGFRLQSGNGLVGIGEAASASSNPFIFGSEWNGDSGNQKGHYLRYFSLTFKVEMTA